MKFQRFFLPFILTFCPAASAATPTVSYHPGQDVEANVARELIALKPWVLKTYRGTRQAFEGVELAKALAQVGRLDSALQFVKELYPPGSPEPEAAESWRNEILNLAVLRRAKLGDLAGAAKLLPSISRFQLDSSLREMALGYLRAGDKHNARQALFKRSSLINSDERSLTETAFLLARSGDLPAAKRLFAAVDDPEAKGAPWSLDPASWRDERRRKAILNYHLKAGFIAEGIKLLEKDNLPLDGELADILLASGQFDPTLKKARQLELDSDQILFMVLAALTLHSKRPDDARAIQIVDQAAERVRQMSPDDTPEDAGFTAYGQDTPQKSQRFLAFGYHALGDDAKAEFWFRKSAEGAKSTAAITSRLYIAILPAFYSLKKPAYIPWDDSALLAQQQAITPLLDSLTDSEWDYYCLQKLVTAELEHHLPEAARINLPTMEKLALMSASRAGDQPDFSPALEVAMLWRRVGDEVAAQKLLLQMINAPSKQPNEKTDLAAQFLNAGFVDEGESWLAKLPVHPGQKRYGAWLAESCGKYRPQKFPTWIAAIKTPKERFQALINFAHGLTFPIYVWNEDY